MKIFLKAKTNNINYALLAIKLLVVIMFVGNLIAGIIKIQFYFKVTGNYDGINSLFDSYLLYSFFRQMIFLSIPMIGIFLKNKVGWVFIISYFYFLLTNILFSIGLFDYKINNEIIITFAVSITLLSLVLILLNKKRIYLSAYKIMPSTLIAYNIAGCIIGVSMTIYLAYARG